MAVALLGGALSALGIVCFGKLVGRGGRGLSDPTNILSTTALGSTPLDVPDVRQPWVSNRTAQNIITYLHFAYPLVLLIFFLAAFTLRSIAISRTEDDDDSDAAVSTQLGPGGKPLLRKSPVRVRKESNKDVLDFSRPRKLLFEWLSLGATLTLIGNAITVVVHALYARDEEWWCGQATVIYLVGSFMVYSLIVISLVDTRPSPTSVHASTWAVAVIMEIVLISASFAVYTSVHREPRVGDPFGGELEREMTEWEITEVTLDLARIILLLALVGFYVLFMMLERSHRESETRPGTPEERRALLTDNNAENGTAHADTNGSANGGGHGYGTTTNGTTKPAKKQDVPAGWEKPTFTPSRSWWEYIKGYSMFFPYLWPSKDRRLQIVVVICFVIMIIQRGIQVLVPNQAGRITDDLNGGENGIPWKSICLFILYRLLQGNNGLLGAIRSTIWVPVSQYSFRELSIASFEHVHSLSLDFHLGKKTGEVLSALGKGNAINNFLESVTFQVFPMLIDLCVAIGYFLIYFDAYYALVVAIVTFWYIYLTIRMAQWRADLRRQMVNSDREVDAVKNDSMVSYETVKYFNAEQHEFARYRGAVAQYQAAEYHVYLSLNFMNVTQNLVFMIGLMISCFIAAYQVVKGQLPVGKFVVLLTYMAQLQGPLNFFGTFYRMIQSAMINSERMLELFKEEPTVVDKPTAKPLPTCEGDIVFNDVHFAYDPRRAALQGLNFRCLPGTTTAFVGESGGGKSTVFRLLFRFYNSESGSILVDGHDIENDVTIDSLRRHIGVVPQDTVLFNETLMYNLKYANPEATEEDVYQACQAASIHDKILSFPDGYQTKVGERGLRLSGGEKQRVAIARTILKNPRIILLDEATAALDTDTEEHIQEALLTLAEGRTMLVIAHRLSTITLADQIVVLHDGRAVETGTHDELLAMKGRYSSMWRKQIRAQRAAEEAKVLKDKADRLRRESHDGSHATITEGEYSAGSSEDEREAQAIAEQAAAQAARVRANSRGAVNLTGILSPKSTPMLVKNKSKDGSIGKDKDDEGSSSSAAAGDSSSAAR
ncbi:putative vacuolar ABC heavy metal transporter [Myriangium duriaei CBS 260.36]|uniref:Vacuolar ABC heavy metal transporter n=1 Tax=Myriangium duriaei CBS 260.36 TaxID=1168546 RepID=A0A9P4MLE5_9PEZI|nr:putative vacuolar ABC heavy metal transporter [Myriangium duriaei CBS 260.36]